MPKLIVINRPLQEAKETEEKIKILGLTPLINPLQEVDFLPLNIVKLKSYTAFLTTSPQAIRALGKYEILHDKKLYVIGEGSQNLATKLGFINIVAGSCDAKALCQRICNDSLNPTKKNFLLYARGPSISFNASSFLYKKNILVEEMYVYTLKKASALGPAIIRAIQSTSQAYFLFYSPSGVRAFYRLLPQQVIPYLATHTACCLSNRIALLAKKLPFQKVLTTPQVNEKFFWDLIN